MMQLFKSEKLKQCQLSFQLLAYYQQFMNYIPALSVKSKTHHIFLRKMTYQRNIKKLIAKEINTTINDQMLKQLNIILILFLEFSYFGFIYKDKSIANCLYFQQVINLSKLQQSKIKLYLMSNKTIYSYLVYGGNNSIVIQQALKKRKNWTPVQKERALDANFIWRPTNIPKKYYNDIDDILRYSSEQMLVNHFQYHPVITSKIGLIRSLKYYYSHEGIHRGINIFDIIPTSFIITPNLQNGEFQAFKERYQQLLSKNYKNQKLKPKHCQNNIWYIKPESQNQGRGISLINKINDLQSILQNKSQNSNWLVQKAIEKPLLYHDRKFDIRVWVLVSPQFDIYFYDIPYMRTSNQHYKSTNLDTQIHLTNNFQQKKSKDYSKFEQGNTIPLSELEKYLDLLPQFQNTKGSKIISSCMNQMKQIIIDSMLSAKKWFTKSIKKKQFQLFGYDFLIDEDLKVWLVQINNNPYLGFPNIWMQKLIPQMVDQMLEIIIDPIFKPSNSYIPLSNEDKNFELIYKQMKLYAYRFGVNSSQSKNKHCFHNLKINGQIMNKSQKRVQGINTERQYTKHKYSTPQETLKCLLDNYMFTDLEPFMISVNLILTSPKLQGDRNLQTNILTLKKITHSRISHILFQSKFLTKCSQIISSSLYNIQIKKLIIQGYERSLKQFNNHVTIIKTIIPSIVQVIKDTLNTDLNDQFIKAVIKLLIKLGGIFQRRIFIPGQSRQYEFIREIFIKSNTISTLLYLRDQYPDICQQQVEEFFANFSNKDWQMYQQVKNNLKIPKDQENNSTKKAQLLINTSIIDEKPRVSYIKHKIGRNRKQSTFPSIKK